MKPTLQNQLANSNYDFYFLVVDPYLDINFENFPNFYSISPKTIGIELEENNSGRLLSHPKTIDFISTNSKNNHHTPVVIPFKPSSRVEKICQLNHWIVACNQTSVSRYLEDKIKFVDFCQKNNLPTVPSLIAKYDPKNFELAQEKFGKRLVIQSHFGWAGNSSHLLDRYQPLNNMGEDTIVKFAPMLTGYSLINNVCLTSQGPIQSPPGLQYTDIKELSTNPLSTVGRQWPSFAPRPVLDKIHTITDQFALAITPLHFKGYFGLDFIVHQDNVYLLECNPRITASFALYAKMESRALVTPLFLVHLATFIGLDEHIDPVMERARFNNSKIIGSEIVKKNGFGKTINKYFEFTPFLKSPTESQIPKTILDKVR